MAGTSLEPDFTGPFLQLHVEAWDHETASMQISRHSAFRLLELPGSIQGPDCFKEQVESL